MCDVLLHTRQHMGSSIETFCTSTNVPPSLGTQSRTRTTFYFLLCQNLQETFSAFLVEGKVGELRLCSWVFIPQSLRVNIWGRHQVSFQTSQSERLRSLLRISVLSPDPSWVKSRAMLLYNGRDRKSIDPHETWGRLPPITTGINPRLIKDLTQIKTIF